MTDTHWPWPTQREAAMTTAVALGMVAVAEIFLRTADPIMHFVVTRVLSIGG